MKNKISIEHFYFVSTSNDLLYFTFKIKKLYNIVELFFNITLF